MKNADFSTFYNFQVLLVSFATKKLTLFLKIFTELSIKKLFFHFCSNPEREEIATQWIEWLCSHHSDFEKTAGVHSSFGQMLLLISIHFHGNNLEPIVELISSTLGMKLRPGSLTKMKILFTQQIFPEKVSLCLSLMKKDFSV